MPRSASAGERPAREDVEDVPVFGRAVGDVAVDIFLGKLDRFEVAQERCGFWTREKSHAAVGSVPLVVDAEELASEDAAGDQGGFQPREYVGEAVPEKERERELCADQVIGREGKVLERRLHDAQASLGQRRELREQRHRAWVGVHRRDLKALLQQVARVAASTRAEVECAAPPRRERGGPHQQLPGRAVFGEAVEASPIGDRHTGLSLFGRTAGALKAAGRPGAAQTRLRRAVSSSSSILQPRASRPYYSGAGSPRCRSRKRAMAG